MTKKMNRVIASILTVLLAGVALAQKPGQTAVVDKAAILKELDKLEQAHQEKATTEMKVLWDSLLKALTSKKNLLSLYEDAVFAIRFEGTKKDNTEFKKWKNAQDDALKSEDFQTALELHANYLHLTYLRANAEKEDKLTEALIQHVFKAWAFENRFDTHQKISSELLDRPINQGLLSKYFRLGPKLGGPQEGEKPKDQDKTWEWNPANADGMLDKTILPFLRKSKNPALIPLWDKRIAFETARAKRMALNSSASKSAQQTLSRLNWRRAADLVLLGKEAEGVTAMITILRQNTTHPDFGKFVQELRAMLTGENYYPAE
jgi:hypothetical protein